MYPKTKGVQSASNLKKPRKNFLNPYQREELRKRLTEKFTKLYGLSDPGMVKMCVDNFFNNNSEINAINLSMLEGNIKSNSIKSRSLVKPGNNVPSGVQKAPSGGQRSEAQSNQGDNLPTLNKSPTMPQNIKPQVSNNQEDEWAKVSKYNYYMFKQEEQ